MDSEGAPDNTQPPRRERRKEPRLSVDTAAVVHLLDIAVRLRGRILDLSMGGCLFRTDESYTLGIFRRVEVEFNAEGMPFRLSGVTQSIHNKNAFGVRFLNVSERKREQLADVIAEIQRTLEAEKEKEKQSAEEAGRN